MPRRFSGSLSKTKHKHSLTRRARRVLREECPFRVPKAEALREAQLWMLNQGRQNASIKREAESLERTAVVVQLRGLMISNDWTKLGFEMASVEAVRKNGVLSRGMIFKDANGRTAPAFWAAFQLAGDWR
jgi:CHAT domain-containing protein